MRLKLVSAPASEPITTSDVQVQSRVTIDSSETAWVGGLITSARQQVEAQLSRALITQTWDLVLDAFPAVTLANPFAGIELPLAPVASIASLKYYDTAGVLQTMDPSLYRLDNDSEPVIVYPAAGADWPDTYGEMAGAVRVQFVAGYGNAAAVPACIKQWMLLQVANMYENRETILTDNRLAQIDITSLADPLLDAVRWRIKV